MAHVAAEPGTVHVLHDRLPVIATWSPPGCRTTALARIMSGRGDVTVLDEPFNRRAADGSFSHRGRTYADDTALLDGVLELAAVPGARTVYFADTTGLRHPALLADPRFTARIQHTFVIRDPAEVIAAHYPHNPYLTSEEVGFGHCWEIFELARMASGTVPVVVDADDLANRPTAVAAACAARTGLPRHPAAGTSGGEPGPARGFRPAAGTVHDNPYLAELYEDQLPYYEWLRAHRLELEQAA
ncbi:sulfotransferase family protein [Streptomyces sp. NPDC089799]|uniref:sulfotransferase-like domain-containing protein n=1 Tax=Streptomyces sp. NPDC089799 TaxID=3155066 RepID=UPI003414CB6E